MRLLAVLALLASSCASLPPVSLDRYRGVYSTHFDGIPDQSRICAVVTNRGGTPIQWVRLRLRAHNNLSEAPSSWRSSWLYEERIEPLQTVTLELIDPPVVDEFELAVIRTGRHPASRPARPARRVDSCSQEDLIAGLETELESRQAPGREVRPMRRRGDETIDVLVAAEP